MLWVPWTVLVQLGLILVFFLLGRLREPRVELRSVAFGAAAVLVAYYTLPDRIALVLAAGRAVFRLAGSTFDLDHVARRAWDNATMILTGAACVWSVNPRGVL
jgi:hypothetical protein